MIFTVMVVVMMIVVIIMLVLTRVVTVVMLDVVMLGDAFEVRLELAVALLAGQRADLHVDIAPSHLRLLIDVAHGEEVGLDLLGQFVSELLMRHLTTAELKLDAHLVAFREEVLRVDDLDVVIVRVDADAEFHFLHLAALLMLVGLLLVLLLDVLVLAVIDNFAHGRIGVRSHFHQVKPTLFGDANGLRSRDDTKLMMTIFLDDAHLRRTNALIDTGLIHKTTIRSVTATGTIATTGTKCSAGTLVATRWTGRSGWPWCSQAWSGRSCGTRSGGRS